MNYKSQLNKGFFLAAKIISSVSALAMIGMIFLGQMSESGDSVSWIQWLENLSEINMPSFSVKAIIFLGCIIVFSLAAVAFSWLNLSVVSMILFVLAGILNSVYWPMMVNDVTRGMGSFGNLGIHLGIGAILLAVFAVIGGIISGIQFVMQIRLKNGSINSDNGSYSNAQLSMQQDLPPVNDNINNFSYGEQMTVPLSDIPVQPKPEPQMSKQQAPKNGTITGINGSCAGFQVHINTGEQVIIGKDANMANIVIDASYGSVSRKHVGISYDVARGKYCVTDYSSNGTFVDGNRLTKNKAVFISPGSEIQIADDKNTFLLG